MNYALECVLEAIEARYGDLNNDCGCYSHNGEWLSIARIVEIINQVAEDFPDEDDE